MDALLQYLANRPATIDGFIGGFISSIIVVTIYDRFMVVRRRPKIGRKGKKAQEEVEEEE